MKLVLFVLASAFALGQAHVSFRYPLPRMYDLDYLDSYRTPFPCGMDKGPVRSTLVVGRTYSFEWQVTNVHDGGFKFELLDDSDNYLLDILPTTGVDDNYIQTVNITIDPSWECANCAVRLEKNAYEVADDYRYFTCADVQIVKEEDYVGDCSGHGFYVAGLCTCDRTYSGDFCQFKDDCVEDVDCNGNGACVDLQGTNYPMKQCFCDAGFFGFNCEKISSIDTTEYDEADYTKEVYLRMNFLYRFVEGTNEWEGIIEAWDTLNWAGVGWRPFDTDESCQAFPTDAPQPDNVLHPMDCSDIVVGQVVDGRSRVEDYYTRDKSQPKPDAYFGGTSSLTGAIGWEVDGATYIRFRRPVTGDGPTDNDFAGKMRLIWAHGQNGESFFGNDEFKFHGKGNRRQETLDLS